jgi:alkanesulfonate monooxygenase SsuD/methylene tetrahydromethanopterin reductase-like flavin-dependent oxidoreductase (luciferase family)
MLKAGRAVIFKPNPNLPDDSVTLDGVCDRLIIHGTPHKVADEIMKFREEVGPFGTMLYAGHDWHDPRLARHSMTLMAEKVLPLVNAAGA